MIKLRLLSVLVALAILALPAGIGLSANVEPDFCTYMASTQIPLASTKAMFVEDVNEEAAVGAPVIWEWVAATYFRSMSEYCEIIEEAWIRNPANNHYYILTNKLPWMEAEAWAQEWGGHLVTLRNWGEELWIKDTFGRYETFWIGFNDIEEEGSWVWSSGEPVVYTNWHEHEPNDCGWPACYPEDAAHMYWDNGDYWNDVPIGEPQYKGVAEIVTADRQLGLCSMYDGDAFISGNPASKGSPVLAGDSLLVSTRSLLALTMPPSEGTRTIYVGGNSRVNVGEESTPSEITIELQYGWLRTRLRDLPEDCSFHVQTPIASANVSGTEFILKGDQTHNTITILEGSADISLPDGTQSIMVTENHEIQITPAGLGEPYHINPYDIDKCWLHNLTILSTTGGSVITPSEGEFIYDAGTVVDLVAQAKENYRFVNWTGDVGTIADVNAAQTTITMGGDYEVTANFAERGGCFVATAAYGTPMAKDIQTLREFRDEYLLTNPLGQGLLDVYYRISPPIADFITEHPSLKPIVRAGLMPIAAMCSIVLNMVPQFAGSNA